MRRRSRRGPNLSESTGKIGQEIPVNQPAPLVPSYVDGLAEPPAAPAPRSTSTGRDSRPATKAPVEQRPEPRKESRPEARPEPRKESRPEARPEPRKETRNEDRRGENRRQRQPRWEVPEGKGKLEVETQPEFPNHPKPEAAAKGAEAPKGYVVLAIGLPGSGKTTWFGRRGVTPLSSDLLRNILFDDVEEQRFQGLVFQTLRQMLRARLIAKMPWNYVDATNLSIHERRQWIKMAQSFGYEVQGVYFDVPLEVCLERNRQRERSVSEEVMMKMAEKLKAPSFDEGFAKITVVRVKSTDAKA